MEKSKSEEFSYNVVAYPGQILAQTHPDRLVAVAKLYGMSPAPAEKCRVLELGCGTGMNLNWLAFNLPHSEFVGVDLAENQILEAQQDAADLELGNIAFYQQDVMEITEKTYGKFDYIIAHGLFSWVPDFVREKVLSLYDELLNPEGIGFISYNVYPGCHSRQIVIDIMKYHTKGIENPVEKVEKGVGFIGFLAKHAVQSYQQILDFEFENLAKYPLANIYHDELSEINQPFYFTEFIAAAENHNLQFLSETENLPTQKDSFSEEVVQVFEGLSGSSVIAYEQYSDFLDNRRFRQTLLCKKNASLEKEISFSALRNLYVSSLLKPASPTIDLNPESFKEFLNFKGQSLDVGHNLTKIVLTYLVSLGVHLEKFDDLVARANDILQSQGIAYENFAEEAETTASLLLQLYSPNAIGFHAAKPNASPTISEKPIVSKFARWQANRGETAVNFYGVGLNLQDDFTLSLLNLLDGTRTRENLLEELTEKFRLSDKITDKEKFLAQMPESLDRDLFILSKMGFLVG